MALSDSEILQRHGRDFVLKPFSKSSINPGGIDLRCDRSTRIRSGEHRLLATLERVELGAGLVGLLFVRSSLAREGLIASLAVVDPGFKGQLTIAVYNAGPETIQIRKGEGIIQLVLIRLAEPASVGYRGRYQDSRSVVTSLRRTRGR